MITYLSIVITFFFLFTKNLEEDVLVGQKKMRYFAMYIASSLSYSKSLRNPSPNMDDDHPTCEVPVTHTSSPYCCCSRKTVTARLVFLFVSSCLWDCRFPR